MESRATRHSAVSAFTETVEFLESSLASLMIGCYFFSRHNRFAETHSHLQLSYHITDRLLAARNNNKGLIEGVTCIRAMMLNISRKAQLKFGG